MAVWGERTVERLRKMVVDWERIVATDTGRNSHSGSVLETEPTGPVDRLNVGDEGKRSLR